MTKAFSCLIAAVALLAPLAAAAEPVVLKLSFFTSDRSNVYQCQLKSFVDAVNAEGNNSIRVEVYFSGAISPDLAAQPQLVADGVADLAIAVPGAVPQRFPDSTVLALPGVFRDEREASHVFVRLAEAGALSGFKDFFVVGAFVSAGENIHSRKPTATLADLNGQKIRVNNQIQARTLEKFGAVPNLLPINRTMSALGEGTIDGATVAPAMAFEFGFARLTSNHYLLPLGAAPTALVMNRAKFDSLPPPAQAIIRKYSGDWLSQRASTCFEAKNRETVAQFEADPRRKVTRPSPADRAASERAFMSVVEEWTSESSRHRELLALVRAELAKLRSPN